MTEPRSHVLFDFFGTLVAYGDDWTSQTYPRSHRLLLEAGARLLDLGADCEWRS